LTFLPFLIIASSVFGQCPPEATITDDFESYVAGVGAALADCWSYQGTDGMTVGVRNTAGEALSGSNYLSCYVGFSSDAEIYLISPELSTLDGMHGALFHVKSSGMGEFEYGTMSDPNDVSSYLPAVSMSNLSNGYEEVNTGALSATAGHVHFVVRATSSSPHSVIRLDDFSWDAVSGTSINSNENLVEAAIYPNPAKDNLIIEFATQRERMVQIIDALGRVVMNELSNNTRIDLDIHELKKGVYFASVIENKGVLTRRIIKVN
jgi:hypothetical protein